MRPWSESPRTGLKRLPNWKQLDPDLLTLDVQMPDMDGIGVLREIKARGLRSKAIMVSGYTTAGAQVTTDALMEGAFDFILKPSGSDSGGESQRLRDSLTTRSSHFGNLRASVAFATSSQRSCEIGRPVTESIPAPQRSVSSGRPGNIDRRPRCLEGGVAEVSGKHAGAGVGRPAHAGKVYQSLSTRLNEFCECRCGRGVGWDDRSSRARFCRCRWEAHEDGLSSTETLSCD